ncbi:glycosyltransferase family 4 protein [Aliarcobacter butzleri]|uniref:glycosyltransferase family 4 protein n=1 Tax=Aliarcobacter butzleri TaxID=28197 RepID=UPI001EDB1A61|nr:glycosyltransferase family 4 protein [Aliarcobacter butzleri]MCG3654158.1 glycosyltransferase family 4 protein [Aliarcobacter butzleri]MCG3697521.1 glycosyltransferase family 4 protein [Aliarcobacter butzleri]MCG3698959.1 glycosyltransferase family 4 protein [Aliarcobacter butzleri]MCT7619684.1 glycosyltransferase family 4 protein [Aliarcobacter butzleri]MDN5091650.1 glycosyltransferase family 4 protein [Aliarcobacter butzleri]
MSKTILFATDLNVWSIKKNIGAPSFYKTLELYNNKGFHIYLYTTEKDCDISELKNITILRIPKLEALNIRYLYSFHRTFNYFLYQFIFLYFYLKNKHFKQIDLLYGYEIEFIPILHLLSRFFKIPYVSRFQGTILYPLMKRKFWKLRYFPHYLSIKLKSNLTIMTDDGTKGDFVIEKLRGNLDKVLFLKNGVDFKKYNIANVSSSIKKIVNKMNEFEKSFISVSRLQKWKRVDRSLDVYNKYKEYNHNSIFVIVGDGEVKTDLQKYVWNKNICDAIFVGGLNADEVNYLLFHSDIFLSHYELSNVGNPLWEAINNQCLVVTINNGDTGKIIVDNCNGIISDEKDYIDNVQKLINLDEEKIKLILENATKTLKDNVKSWNERMEIEYHNLLLLLKENCE